MTAPTAFPPSYLRASRLTVRRGEKLLFEGLGFELKSGDVLLLRGPNGVGKTSLLLALCGIVRTEAGDVAFSAAGEAAELMPQTHLLLPRPAVKPRLSLIENLTFWRVMNGASGLDVEAALERVGLGGLDLLEAGHLSTGQTRRLALARLIVARRPVWLLDEPTAALDKAGEALVGELIEAHRAAGGLAVVATHYDLGLKPDGVTTLILGDAA